MGPRIKPVRGSLYGRLTILVEEEPRYAAGGQKKFMVSAQCLCGVIKSYDFRQLRKGHTMSCGCLQKDTIAKISSNLCTHGLSTHPLYGRWTQMMRRVYNPESNDYVKYRNIKVCERWHSIENYIEDVYPTFFSYAQLDRIDNHGDYTPRNTQWLDSTEHGIKSSKDKPLKALQGEKDV